jgi:hypothetical protein
MAFVSKRGKFDLRKAWNPTTDINPTYFLVTDAEIKISHHVVLSTTKFVSK